MSQRKPSSQMAGDWQVTSLKSKHQPRFQNKITPSTPTQEKFAQVVRGRGEEVSPSPGNGIPVALATMGARAQSAKLADGPMLIEAWGLGKDAGPGRLGKINEVLDSQEILVG